MSASLTISIGDTSISIKGAIQEEDWVTAPAYRAFIRDGERDIGLRLHRGGFDSRAGEEIFDCPPIWALCRQNGTSIVKIFHGLPGLERTLVFPRRLKDADIYFSDTSNRFIDPFFGPTMELLMMHYLAQGRGVIMHACGVKRDGKGILFAGESGAGKSTIAELWNRVSGVDILSDDRIILRKRGHRFWMYGTPWHGDARFSSPKAVKLERLFFLRKARKNGILKVKGVNRVSQLLTCSFPPLWDARGMVFNLDFFKALAARVPTEELAFRPDKTAIDFIIEELGD